MTTVAWENEVGLARTKPVSRIIAKYHQLIRLMTTLKSYNNIFTQPNNFHSFVFHEFSATV